MSGVRGEGTAYLEDCNRLYAAGVGDVRADAEIDHGTAAVHSRRGAVRNLVLDDVHLEGVVLFSQSVPTRHEEGEREETNGKHLEQLLLSHDESLELLLLLDDVLGERLQRRVVRREHSPACISTVLEDAGTHLSSFMPIS